MKTLIVIHKATGTEYVGIYSHNSCGNLRINVDGKFYTDKQFDKTFTIKQTCESCGEPLTKFREDIVCSSITVRNNCNL